MGLLFEQEHQVEVFGFNGEVVITETDEFDEEHIVILSLRQFEEIANRYKQIIAEALEDSNGLD